MLFVGRILRHSGGSGEFGSSSDPSVIRTSKFTLAVSKIEFLRLTIAKLSNATITFSMFQ